MKKFTIIWGMLSFLFFSTIPADVTHAQENRHYRIAAYEKICDGPGDTRPQKYRCQIRSLFLKTDTGWVAMPGHEPGKFVAVYKGRITGKVAGTCCPVAYSFDSAGKVEDSVRYEELLLPERLLPEKNLHFAAQLREDEARYIQKAAFLSDNPDFIQHAGLKPYRPAKKEIAILSDNVRNYIAGLLKSNKSCTGSFGLLPDSLADILLRQPAAVAIDYTNSFSDSRGNKLIRVRLPSYPPLAIIYPFAGGTCWREDNGYMNFEVMCYLDNKGNGTVLQDLLRYMDHGDFDGDGKDEYLFWYTRFNRAGYVMFYDDFRKSVSSVWSYH